VRNADDQVSRLERIEFFYGLPRDQVPEIARQVRWHEFQAGEVIFSPDQEAVSFYVIEEGKVRLSRASEQGKELTLAIIGAGGTFGELNPGETRRQRAYAEALITTTLCELPRTIFTQLVATVPELGLRAVESLAERLAWAEAQIEDLVFRSVPERVASLLLRLSEAHGRVGPTGVLVDLRLTHQEVGNMVGATRETITNVLNAMRAEGLIEVEHKRIRLLSPERLAQRARH